MQGLETDNI